MTTWSLGCPDRALETMRDAAGLAEELTHPFSKGLARFYTAVMHQFRREADLAQQHAEAAIAIAGENDFTQLVGQGYIMRGWAVAAQGRIEEGIAQIREGLQSSHPAGTGTGARRPYFLCLLAETYGRAGRAEHGLDALEEAIEEVEKTGEVTWEAEIHRTMGQLLAASAIGKAAEAMQAFERALEIARAQGARLPELRAATGLARLYRTGGDDGRAGDLLAPIAEWFTEGLETADLTDAKALLDESR